MASEAQRKLNETRAIVNNLDVTANLTESSLSLLAKLENELKGLELNKKGAPIETNKLPPKNKKRIAEICEQLELIKIANGGQASPRTWAKFFQDQGALLQKSTQLGSIARNICLFAACTAAAFVIAPLILNPVGLPLFAIGATLFVGFKLASMIARWCWSKYNDSPGARMEAAAEKAGLFNMTPIGRTQASGVANANENGRSTPGQNPTASDTSNVVPGNRHS